MLKVLTAALKEAVNALEKFDNNRDAISPEEYFRISLAPDRRSHPQVPAGISRLSTSAGYQIHLGV